MGPRATHKRKAQLGHESLKVDLDPQFSFYSLLHTKSPESKPYRLWNLQKEEVTSSAIEDNAREIAKHMKVRSKSGDYSSSQSLKDCCPALPDGRETPAATQRNPAMEMSCGDVGRNRAYCTYM